jgi:hypothetical protein
MIPYLGKQRANAAGNVTSTQGTMLKLIGKFGVNDKMANSNSVSRKTSKLTKKNCSSTSLSLAVLSAFIILCSCEGTQP